MIGNVCFFNTAIAWGGGEKWHFDSSTYLYSKGHKVIVVAHEKSVLANKLSHTKIPFETLKIDNLSFLNPFKLNKVKKILKKYDTTCIVMNLSRDLKIAGMAAKQMGVKRIIYRRGSAIPIKNTFLNRFYFGKVLTDVLSNSKATKETITQNYKRLFPKNRIKTIYNGIDVPQIKEHLGQILPKENGIYTLLTLGRLEYQKNHAFLIDIAKELKHRGLKFRLLIGGEGSLREKLSKSIQDNDVRDCVTLCGFIDDPIKFIAQADVFLLPSWWEGFGYVLAEAALCKKPVIAFDISSNPELVLHQKTGFLTPKNDRDAFCGKIEFLYRYPGKRHEMGIEGEKYVTKKFNKANQLKELENYLVHA